MLKLRKKSVDRTPNKKQPWDNHNNRIKPQRENPRLPFMKQVMEDIGPKTWSRELKTTISDREI